MRIPRLLVVTSNLLMVSGALLLLAVGASAQETKHKVLHLLSESPVHLQDGAVNFLGAPQCDNDGGLFVRLVRDGAADPLRTPVRRISPSGNTGPSFSLSDVPRFDLSVSAQSPAFSVAGNGGVDFLAQRSNSSGRGLYVIRFTAGGHYLSTLKLTHFFQPHGFAALPGGGYFVLGTVRDVWNTTTSNSSAPNVTLRPVGVFFSPTGKLLWEINMQGTLPRVPGSGKSPSKPAAFGPGMVAAGPAGNVYVKRVKPANSFYVITHGGADVSTIDINPPFPKAVITSIEPVAAGKLAVQFSHAPGAADSANESTVFSIVDALSGMRLIDYHASPEVAGALGCYTQGGFELLAHQVGGGLSVRFVSGNQRKQKKPAKQQN